MLYCYGRKAGQASRDPPFVFDYELVGLVELDPPYQLLGSLFAALFFALLLDLARKLAAGAEQLARQSRTDAQNLATQNAELFLAAGPFADSLHLVGRERLTIHYAALGQELFKVLIFGNVHDFFGQRNDIFAAPNKRHLASRVLERLFQSSALRGSRGQAVLDHQQVNVLLPKPLPQCDALIILQTNHIHQERIIDALQPIAKVLRNHVFDEFAHVLGCWLSAESPLL